METRKYSNHPFSGAALAYKHPGEILWMGLNVTIGGAESPGKKKNKRQ